MKQYLALEASAGSGKTFALSVRYISLLLLDVEPSSILTLTFTNKAALEMSERIFKTLIRLGEDEIIINEIIKETHLSKKEILNKKEKVLQNYLQSELAILTLDKFMNKVLREFSGYLGLGEDFSIINNDHDFLLYKFMLHLDLEYFDALVFFSNINNSSLKSLVGLFDILDEKNEQYDYYQFQQEVLEGFESNIIQYANTIKKEVEKLSLSASALKAVTFGTIEEIMDKTWLSKDSLAEYHYFKKAKEKIVNLDPIFLALKEQLKYYINYQELGRLNTLFKIYNHYREFRITYKKEKNQLKFSDVTNLVYELLEKHIDKDFLYFRLDSKYHHIMIDEFQDTSVLQFKILKPLIDEILSGNDERYKTFFYVGDTKQSIYRFRGGKKELFNYVYQNYKPDLQLDSLNTNYRSAKNIVSFANQLFLAQNNYKYHKQSVNSQIEGYVEISSIENEEEPFEDVKNKVSQLLDKGIDPNNIAILTYTNDDVLGIYEYLKKSFPHLKIVTDMNSKLINQKNVKTLIHGIKSLYFKEEKIYLSTFNSLMGFDLEQPLLFQKDLQSYELIDLLYHFALYYKLLDENMIKFLDVAKEYGDVVSFVYEIDQLESSMISKEYSGLQILTIFKSKGLEFDSVILLDRIKQKVADRSRLLFYYKDIQLHKIFFKNKSRVYFDPFYKDAIEHEVNQTLDDELNILYVAITRAKYNLCIVKKKEKSVFDIFDFDIKNFSNMGDIHISKTQYKKDNPIQSISYKPLSFGVQEVENKTILDDSDNLKARYFGLATHYCLEMIKDFNTKSLEAAMQLTHLKYNQWLNEQEFEDLYTRIMILLQNKQFQELVVGGEVFKEQELIFNKELKIVDLLIDKKEKVLVIDYKTTQSISDKHIDQVKLYTKGIQEITQKNVMGYLIYLQSQEIKIIPI